MTAKPTLSELGIDPAAQVWHRSGQGDGAIEIAFVHAENADRHTKNADRHTKNADSHAGNARTHIENTDPHAGNAERSAGNTPRTARTTPRPARNAPRPARTTASTFAEPPADRAEWVLMRVAGDPDDRVLVFDRHEWECFLDGARGGEFDDAAASP